jgi:hypothetical protein
MFDIHVGFSLQVEFEWRVSFSNWKSMKCFYLCQWLLKYWPIRLSVSSSPKFSLNLSQTIYFFYFIYHFQSNSYIKLSKYFSILTIYYFLLVLRIITLTISQEHQSFYIKTPSFHHHRPTKTPNRFELQTILPQSTTHKTKNLNFRPLQTSTQYHQNLKITQSNTHPIGH